MVRWALEHSPTFRQQCRVLAAAPRLRATVSVAPRLAGATSRARTSFRQGQWGALAADIEIRSVPDLTELLAHEFEHLIEQLDGVDLQALAKEGEARRLPDGAFETDRAIAAGQQVAGEVVDNAPDRVRGAGASVWRALRRAIHVSAAARQARGRVQRGGTDHRRRTEASRAVLHGPEPDVGRYEDRIRTRDP